MEEKITITKKYMQSLGMNGEQFRAIISDYAGRQLSSAAISNWKAGISSPEWPILIRIWLLAPRGSELYNFAIEYMNEIDPGLGDDLDARD